MNVFPASIARSAHLAAATAALLLSSLAAPFPAQAHHSFAAVFDADNVGTIAGEVVEVRFGNPHVRFRLLAEFADGTTEEWDVQTHNVATMLRMGWNNETVRVGDVIEVTGALGRNGARRISLDTVVLADGSLRTPRGGEVNTAYTVTEVNADPATRYGAAANTDYPVDVTGLWTNNYNFTLTVDDLEPKPTPFTAEGRRLFEAAEPWQDPRERCAPGGLPRMFGAPYSMQILDAGSHYLMLLDVHPRRIWMDGRQAAADVLPSAMGFSRGRWDGDELVIETTRLLPGWLDGSGLPMSGEGTRLVERYTFSNDRLTMDRVMTIHDPYYTTPLTRTRASARDDNLEAAVAGGGPDCESLYFFRDLHEQGLLESLWESARR